MNQAKLFIVCTFLLAFAIGVSFTFLFSFSPQVLAQEKLYPNELKGFEFFGNGKLKTLKLGYSEKKDIEIIFGESCENYCDYDENFQIKFEYLAALDDCMTTEDIRNRVMCPQNDFVGSISSITLKPKQQQNLKELSTSIFNKLSGGSIGEKENGVSVSFTAFADKYGLKYSIGEESGKAVIYSQYPPFVEGKLYSINYDYTDDFIRKVFTVEYMTRKKELNQ